MKLSLLTMACFHMITISLISNGITPVNTTLCEGHIVGSILMSHVPLWCQNRVWYYTSHIFLHQHISKISDFNGVINTYYSVYWQVPVIIINTFESWKKNIYIYIRINTFESWIIMIFPVRTDIVMGPFCRHYLLVNVFCFAMLKTYNLNITSIDVNAIPFNSIQYLYSTQYCTALLNI